MSIHVYRPELCGKSTCQLHLRSRYFVMGGGGGGGGGGRGDEVRGYLKVVSLHKLWTFCPFCPKIVGLDVQRAIVKCDHPYRTLCTSLSVMDRFWGAHLAYL